MLLQFSFKNFKSFKDEKSLDLTATKESELSYHIRKSCGEKILPVAAIYGANASGKSNVFDAFGYMRETVINSLNYGIESYDYTYNRPIPFLFDSSSSNEPTAFEVYFTLPYDENELTYNYGFSLDENGVVEEWLNTIAKTGRKPVKVFYRNRMNVLELDGFSGQAKNILKLVVSDKTLLVTLGSKLKIDKLAKVYSFFNSLVFTNFSLPLFEHNSSKTISPEFYKDKNVQKRVINYLSTFDDSIVDFRIKNEKNNFYDENTTLKIETGHKNIDTGEITYIPLESESSGTLKMFSLYRFVQNVLDNGSLLFVDELNARLHPLLVRAFIQLFTDPIKNRNNSQLIFTSHDSCQLYNNSLRRDEVWFTDKDKNGITDLYSLSDFIDENGKSVRNDENYEKNYLLGKYGGIPELKSFEMFLGEDSKNEF